ncbi:MAG TPA: thiamine-phosphate kinase [Gemmatimonadales bacterium]|jgi:thiamine-monophosphate kinase|nr:thiamine-phosphate kinase [Gemmatimonadales bacterium]
MTHTALGAGREFDRVRAIARALGQWAVALGDDCALLEPAEGRLAVSTDVSVEAVHFRLEWMGHEEIGWRAAAAALSDLAAEGATPAGLLAAVVVPESATDEQVTALMSGVGAAGESVGAPVIGGDLSSGPGWSVAVTVLGWTARPVGRHGARPGDLLWVTGALGGARAALAAWRRGDEPSVEARAAFARPEPRIEAGRWLAAHGAHAMIDLSDGLGGDAEHLAAGSAVSLELALEAVPVAPAAVAEARRAHAAVETFAAEGGEDYELLAALPPAFGEAERVAFERDCRLSLSRIGAVGAGHGVQAQLRGVPVSLGGYRHFG